MAYEKTRAKIKNYLDALRKNYSTTEWAKFDSFNISKEFGVSITLSQILKNKGYIFREEGNIMLHPTIYFLSEDVLHQELLDYSYGSALRKEERKKAQKKRRKEIVDNYRKKENKVEESITIEVPFSDEDLNKLISLLNQDKYQNFFVNLLDEPLFKELIEKLTHQSEPSTISLPEMKQKLKNDPNYKDLFNNRRGRPSKSTNELIKKRYNEISKKQEKVQSIIKNLEENKKEPEVAPKKQLKPLFEVKEPVSVSVKNGYACPKCGDELYDTNPSILLTEQSIDGGMVNKTIVHCDCGFVERRIVSGIAVI